MELKIDVSMPTKSARYTDNCEDIIRHGLFFSDAYIETLESKIVISGLPNPCDGTHAKIHLEYFEKYQPDTSLKDFFERAEKFSRDYCAAIGIGATKISDTQSGVTYSGRMAINVSKPNKISIFDGDGKLRCVLGPLDVEQGDVFIKNATIQKVIFSANSFDVNKSEKENAVNNTENSNADSYYDELNKKLDYIISLMPALRF